METAVLAGARGQIVDEVVAALERSRRLSVGGQYVTERGCPRTAGRFQGRRIRLVRLVGTVHISEGGGQSSLNATIGDWASPVRRSSLGAAPPGVRTGTQD